MIHDNIHDSAMKHCDASLVLREHCMIAVSSLGHHHLDKLLVVDLSITINICLSDHLIYFFVGELLAEICHDVAQLGSTNESVAIAVEDLECFNQFLLGIRVLHLSCHQGQEF